MQIMRTVITIIVMVTMAMMIFSLRDENNELRDRLRKHHQAQDGVYVLCRFDLKPDADIGEYVKRTLSVVPTVRSEEGCQLYTLLGDAHTDWDKPQRFGDRTMWMLEKWDSIDALKAHLDTAHMKAFGPTVKDMRVNGTFHVLEELR